MSVYTNEQLWDFVLMSRQEYKRLTFDEKGMRDFLQHCHAHNTLIKISKKDTRVYYELSADPTGQKD